MQIERISELACPRCGHTSREEMPEVSHPRWSQATERTIGGGLFAKRKETLMFNGYEEEVAGMYAGMDLAKNY